MTDATPTTDLREADTFDEVATDAAAQLELLQEQIGALELALEDAGWQRLAFSAVNEFSKPGLDKIAELARMMRLKNPLIRRAVETKANYVWGQGVTITATPAPINVVVQAFLDDEKNAAELTGHQARLDKEAELQCDGNIFLVLFPNRLTGRVRVRSVPMAEIVEVIANPDDAKEPWYYKRVWTAQALNTLTGAFETRPLTAYYPDWRYTPAEQPKTIGDAPVRWESPIYRTKVGGFSDWRFGVSELYAALDWARAYKEFLEDVATLMRAYSRFAWKVTTKGGKAGVQAAKAKLGSTLGSGAETNPPPVAGSAFIGGENADLSPLNVRGASVAPEDGRRFLLMVAAAVGLPEPFFGDADVGNHATAKTLDRPTELQMRNRQTLWSDVHTDLLNYVIAWAVKAPGGALRTLASVTTTNDGAELVDVIEWKPDPETGEPIAPSIKVEFPPILNSDPKERVSAIVEAATLAGKPLAGTIDDKTVSRMLLSALGAEDIDALLATLYPEDGSDAAAADAIVREATTELRAAIAPVLAKYREAA